MIIKHHFFYRHLIMKVVLGFSLCAIFLHISFAANAEEVAPWMRANPVFSEDIESIENIGKDHIYHENDPTPFIRSSKTTASQEVKEKNTSKKSDATPQSILAQNPSPLAAPGTSPTSTPALTPEPAPTLALAPENKPATPEPTPPTPALALNQEQKSSPPEPAPHEALTLNSTQKPITAGPVPPSVPTAPRINEQTPGFSPGVIVIRRSPEASETNTREYLADSLQSALVDNPEVLIARAREDDARYGVAESRAAYLPHLDLSANAGGEYSNPDGPDSTRRVRREASLVSRQLLWDFGLTINNIRRARKIYEAASEATKEQVEDISFQIATAYINVLQRQRIAVLTRENVAAHEKILKIVSTQKELGLSTGADVSRVETQLSRIQSALLDRKSELEQAREGFRRLTNRLPGDLMEPPSADGIVPQTPDSAAELISSHNPRLKEALANKASIERQLASNQKNYYPRFDLELQGNYRYDVQGNTRQNIDSRAVVTLRYNLLNGGADQAVSNRIRSRIREQGYEVERIRREVEQDIRSDFSALKASREKIEKINSEVEAASKVVNLYTEQFKTGKRSAFDLLDSQQNFFNARSSQIANQYQSLISSYRVLQRLGLLFTTITEAPPAADRKL